VSSTAPQIEPRDRRGARLVIAKGLSTGVQVAPELAISTAKLTARQAIALLLPDDPDEARNVLDRAIEGLERLVSNGPAELAAQALREVRDAL
jgi:enoyl-CoA hydratase/carnithine racemase